jgi:hypothetical protein
MLVCGEIMKSETLDMILGLATLLTIAGLGVVLIGQGYFMMQYSYALADSCTDLSTGKPCYPVRFADVAAASVIIFVGALLVAFTTWALAGCLHLPKRLGHNAAGGPLARSGSPASFYVAVAAISVGMETDTAGRQRIRQRRSMRGASRRLITAPLPDRCLGWRCCHYLPMPLKVIW